MEETASKNREKWVDSLKFIACIGVVAIHFVQAFYLQSEYGGGQLSDFEKKTIDFFVWYFARGYWWVEVFCIISGYLIGKKRITTLIELMREIVKRYFRFVAPFLIMVIIWELLYLIPVKNEILYLFPYFLPPDMGIKNAIRTIFLFDYVINAPLWCIKALFVANIAQLVMIYILNVIRTFLGKHKISDTISEAIEMMYWLSIILVLLITDHTMILICVVGMLIPKFIFVFEAFPRTIKIVVWIVELLYMFGGVKNHILEQISALIFVMLVFSSEQIKNVLELDGLKKLNHLSFPIYIYHRVILRTISPYIYETLISNMNYYLCFWCNMIISVVSVVLFAYLYAFFASYIKKCGKKERCNDYC